MRFDIATPAEIRFGAGRATEVPEALDGLGVRQALVITGATPQRADGVRVALADAGIASEVFPVSGEPSLDVVRAGVSALTRAGCDGVLGYGGGRGLGAAKTGGARGGAGT